MIRIAIIDQDKELLEAGTLILEAKGYEVLTSTDLTAGKQIISESHPDLVILDSIDYDSKVIFKFAESLKKAGNHISILMFKTAKMEIGIDDSKYVDDFIIKPFSPSELVSKVERYLLLNV